MLSLSMATIVTYARSRRPAVTPAVSSLPVPTNGRELNIVLIPQQITKNYQKWNQEIVATTTRKIKQTNANLWVV